MNIPVEVLVALIGAAGITVGAVLAFIGGRSQRRADVDNKNTETIKNLSDVVDSFEKRLIVMRGELDAYKQQIADKDGELKEKTVTIETLSRDVNELKTALKNVFEWLKENGIEVPQDKMPRPGLLDTHPKIPTVKGKGNK